MKNFFRKNKLSLVIGTYLVLFGAFAYFMVLPEVKSIIGKAEAIERQGLDQKIDEERTASLPSLEEGYKSFKDNEGRFEIVIGRSSEVDFIKELEKLAEETQNKIELRVQEDIATKVPAKKKEKDEDIKSKLAHKEYLSMQIALEGNYENLRKFLYKLENFHKYVNIISISSEKKQVENKSQSGPFVSKDGRVEKTVKKEVVNTILSVVVYSKD